MPSPTPSSLAGAPPSSTPACWRTARSSALSLVVLGLIALTAAVRPGSAASTPLGVPTPLVDPGHRGLAHYYAALQRTQGPARTGTPPAVARALHYGDSTIAGDGLSRTLRARLAARFGDAGPGFVSASFNPKWSARADVSARRTGEWDWRTILLGGGGGRYGLGGVVGILAAGAGVRVSAVGAVAAGVLGATSGPVAPTSLRHVEIYYQAGAGYGTIWAAAGTAELLRASAATASTEDRRFVVDLPEPATELRLGASGGPVPVYGVVLETGTAGTTWEAQGVIGVGSRSFTTFARDNLAAQMPWRSPDLVVVMLGGNEASYPTLTTNGGLGYLPMYEAALKTILAGKGDASCLVMAPLDQGYFDTPATSEAADATDAERSGDAGDVAAAGPTAPVERGPETARPGMANLVAMQSTAAANAGCAFWNTWAAMGGAGSALTWAHARGLGTGDLVHLTPLGLERIGNLEADALLAGFDAWAAGS